MYLKEILYTLFFIHINLDNYATHSSREPWKMPKKTGNIHSSRKMSVKTWKQGKKAGKNLENLDIWEKYLADTMCKQKLETCILLISQLVVYFNSDEKEKWELSNYQLLGLFMRFFLTFYLWKRVGIWGAFTWFNKTNIFLKLGVNRIAF